ncbi:unnamed protein product [Bathycoccus prasinos]
MVSFLEKRLDTVLKVKVNGVIIQVPSFQLYPGDVISLDDGAQDQVRQTMRDFLNRQEEQSGLKNFSAKNEQDFTNTVVWYKTTYCEVNYKTLEIVILFAPQNVHYPMKAKGYSALYAKESVSLYKAVQKEYTQNHGIRKASAASVKIKSVKLPGAVVHTGWDSNPRHLSNGYEPDELPITLSRKRALSMTGFEPVTSRLKA